MVKCMILIATSTMYLKCCIGSIDLHACIYVFKLYWTILLMPDTALGDVVILYLKSIQQKYSLSQPKML